MGHHRLVWVLGFLLNLGNASGEWIHFDSKGLTSIPDDIEPTVDLLYCSKNNISAIHRSDFNDKYPDLYYITLTDNIITSIESGCFRGTILTSIFLTRNQLTAFPDFHEVKDYLKHVFIAKNLITNISRGEVDYLTKMTELILQDNPIVQLPEITKLGLPVLKLLDLRGIEMDCCSSNVWLKRTPDILVLHIDYLPCSTPSKWTATPWVDITEDMLLLHHCGENFVIMQ